MDSMTIGIFRTAKQIQNQVCAIASNSCPDALHRVFVVMQQLIVRERTHLPVAKSYNEQ
jgi:hypothetical protein